MNLRTLATLAVIVLMTPISFAADTKLVLTGSSTIAPLALEIGRRFESLNPGVRVDVQSGGSSRGISDARSGLADIGLVSRALKPEEADLKAHLIARDGVSVILHASNPVKELTKAQIIAIYTGSITNWKTLGGRDQVITVVNKAEGRSTLELFTQFFGLKNEQIRAQVIIGDNQQGIKTVAGNPGAIGYVSIGTAEYEANVGTPIQLIALNGVEALVANVSNESFPLSRPLNLVTKTKPAGLAKRFIDFAQSAAVHDIIRDQFFVPVSR